MKKLALITVILISLMLTGNRSFSQTVTADEQCKNLGRGVNIIGYDKAFWDDYTKGRFKESYFKMIKEAGFSNIRVNLYAFSHMNKISYLIDPKWLHTLDWVIKKGLDAKLMVILDMHEFTQMANDPIEKKEMFLSVWRQLAPRYKNQPSQVIFELLNEPN